MKNVPIVLFDRDVLQLDIMYVAEQDNIITLSTIKPRIALCTSSLHLIEVSASLKLCPVSKSPIMKTITIKVVIDIDIAICYNNNKNILIQIFVLELIFYLLAKFSNILLVAVSAIRPVSRADGVVSRASVAAVRKCIVSNRTISRNNVRSRNSSSGNWNSHGSRSRVVVRETSVRAGVSTNSRDRFAIIRRHLFISDQDFIFCFQILSCI
jgi:hypothetical protein